MKVFRVLPSQVPRVWDKIKFAAVRADNVRQADLMPYLTRLLESLLNDNSQCFIRMDNNEVQALAITKYISDEFTGSKSLLIQCLYSFQIADMNQWRSDIGIIRDFAKANGCDKIITFSSNPRVFDIVSNIGFSERYRSFFMEV